jgi:PhnB protein
MKVKPTTYQGEQPMTTINPYINFNGNENENRSKIAVSADSREDAENIFTGLSAGGTIEMPIGDSLWGTYFAMFRDRFGIEWTVEY